MPDPLFSPLVMIHKTIQIRNRLGLHARAAARFVKTASRFKSDVKLSKTGSKDMVDGKSILEILKLAAQSETTLALTVSGEDEQEAYQALRSLVEANFGEE